MAVKCGETNYSPAMFYSISPGVCIIKLITAVIYCFSNKLVFIPKYWSRLERLARDKHSSLLRRL
jgi:hypothetical protein